MNNKISLKFSAISENESFARSVIGIFALKLNPTLSELEDIKTSVSEAVTNCIVHAYGDKDGEIEICAETKGNVLHINVFDNGVGIEDVEKALEPFYTSKPEDERSGMGFTIMKSFMDEIKVTSSVGFGTKVYMLKKIGTDAREKNVGA